jgi:hypothetical protein
MIKIKLYLLNFAKICLSFAKTNCRFSAEPLCGAQKRSRFTRQSSSWRKNRISQFVNPVKSLLQHNAGKLITLFTAGLVILIFIFCHPSAMAAVLVQISPYIAAGGHYVYYLIVSSLIYLYIINKLKFSNNTVINYLQKLFLSIFIFKVISYCLFYAGIYFGFIPIVEFTSAPGRENKLGVNYFLGNDETSNNETTEPLSRKNNSNNNETNKLTGTETSPPAADAAGGGNATGGSNDSIKDVISVRETEEDNKKYYDFRVRKDYADKALKFASDLAKNGLTDSSSNKAAAGAGALAALGVFKATGRLALGPRMAAIGTTSAMATAGAKAGLEIGKALIDNIDIVQSVKDSKHSNPDPDRIPSPDIDIINSALENGDLISPLEVLLNSQFSLNVLIFFLIFSLLFLTFYKFFFKENINLIRKYLPLPNNIKDKYINYLDNSANYNSKFILIMFILDSLLLILFLLLNLFVSAELSNNIDNYVIVYNYIHNKKSSLLLLTFTASCGRSWRDGCCRGAAKIKNLLPRPQKRR